MRAKRAEKILEILIFPEGNLIFFAFYGFVAVVDRGGGGSAQAGTRTKNPQNFKCQVSFDKLAGDYRTLSLGVL